MVSINTNLSSLMVQGNLSQATNGLNKAIERLSTGYKINHSSDNAANYSIANNYEAKLSSFDMAADNVGMGSDLLAVAQDTISSMQDHGARLHALITQARNGTYGAQSLNALTQEAGALISEIQRMYTNAEYNGIDLFDNMLPNWAKEVREEAGLTSDLTPKYNGFINNPETYTKEEVAAMTKVADVESFTAGQKYSISSKEELAKLATKVNSGTDTTNVEFVLGDDIDLKDYQDGEGWVPIGTTSNSFRGTFDGNGHKVSNLKIDRENADDDCQGLFGHTATGSIIKNVGVVDVNINVKTRAGAIVGSNGSDITNCYATGTITGNDYLGGLTATWNRSGFKIDNCYSTCDIKAAGSSSGGLVGTVGPSTIIQNCFTTGNIKGVLSVGGIAGSVFNGTTITNCYATGDITGRTHTGGLLGYGHQDSKISHSYATGSVTATEDSTGGIAGYIDGTVSDCYSLGSVTGKNSTGGLLGQLYIHGSVKNSYSTGIVSGTGYVGGLIGLADGAITNSYATGDVKGTNWTGGLVGRLFKTSGTLNLNNLFASGNVTCNSKVGSLIGGINNTNYGGASFSTINITNAKVANSELMAIGFEGASDGTGYKSGQMSTWLENIKQVKSPETTLQVGIHGDESSKITFNTGFEYDLSAILKDIKSDDAYNAINKFMSTLSDKATELGSVSNRLESALDSIVVNMENITSSLSTIKDADMATESSQYIKMQILQQASATLLATANQSPSIALQLI